MPDGDHVLRVVDRLARARVQLCVGRERERRRLESMLAPGGPAVVFVHGAPGIGKSVLVDAVVAATGRPAIRLDARRVEPTAASFLEASSTAVRHPAATPGELGDAMQQGDISLLVVDGYERLRLIDDWIRDHLVPALPALSTTVLVSRTPPNAAWRSGEWRQLANEVEVGPMSQHDATELVEQRIGRGDATGQVLRFGRGHPLALHLAADAVARRPDLTLHDGPPPEVVEELVDVFLDELPASMRTAVQDVSLLRRVTLPTLTALCADTVPHADVDDVWQTLRELAFVSVGPVGLELDRVVQDVIAASVELHEPGRARRIRQIAGAAAFDEATRSPGWESTADLLHLVQNPVIRDAFSPPPGQQYVIDAARSPDRDAVDTLVGSIDGDSSAWWLEAWWQTRQSAFRALRASDGTVRGVAIVAPFDLLAPEIADRDPVVARIAVDLRRRPLRADQRALVVRRVLTTAAGELPSSEYSALIVDLKRYYLELRPALVRVYAVGLDKRLNAAVLEPMGFKPMAGDVDHAEQQFGIWSLEFGSRSVDEWLARHIEIETAGSQNPQSPANDRLDDPLPDGVRQLSAREREVLAALALGLTNRELAERLFISERTAIRHLTNIFVKLAVRNRTEATRIAVAAGIA
ncbi:MAG: LuxR C-terminal-related transcriptional regulator [Ilumatobacteraceae bacterium]